MYPQPDQALKQLLGELELRWREKFSFFDSSRVLGILEQISRNGDPAALPYLIQWVHHRRAKWRNCAERAVAIILPKLRIDQVLELESLIRESWLKFGSYDSAFRAQTEAGWKLSTLDANGWRREKAVIALDKDGDTSALPFVLLRLNDWVPNVRVASQRWFDSQFNTLSVEQIAACLPILAALNERSQSRAMYYVRSCIDRMATDAAAPGLIDALPSANSRARQLAFSILAKSGALRDLELQNKLLHGADPMLALLLLKHLQPAGAGLPDDLVERALGSKSAMVRRFAMYRMSEAQVEKFSSAVEHAFFDPTAGLREYAQFQLLKTHPPEELQSRYATAVRDPRSSNRTIAASILGLRETGGVLTESECVLWMDHASLRVRASALRAFAAWHFDEALPRLREALLSVRSPTMGKTALGILRRHPNAVSTNEIRTWLESETPLTVRMRALTLLANCGKWQRLPVLLKMSGHSDDVIREKAKIHLWEWFRGFNNSQVQPSRAQVEEALIELSRAEVMLETRLTAEFRALLTAITPRIAA